MKTSWIAGVDGCRSGWFAVLVRHARGRVIEARHDVCRSFKEVLNLTPAPNFIAIDIPIGLLEERREGGRECDREARRRLGFPRAASVFSPPSRRVLPVRTFSKTRGQGVTLQAFGLFPKIREVDAEMTPALQQRVREVHPESSLGRLGGRAMRFNKKKPEGRKERLRVLSKVFPDIRKEVLHAKGPGVGYDDIIDAYAAAWTGMRIETGAAERLPKVPQVDSRGLRMEIWV